MAAKVKGMGEELIHISTVCDMFRVSRRTLYSRIKEKVLTAEMSGGATYLRLSELQRLYGVLVSSELMKNWKFDPETNGYVPLKRAGHA